MSHEYVLTRKQIVPLSRPETFRFFEDAGNLEAITPPSLQFRILTPQPVEIRIGALIDYRLRLCGIPIRWRTRIEEHDPPNRFVDLQLRGPYALWHHTHEFRDVDGGTEMTDRVRYRIGWGPLGGLAHVLFVKRMLRHIFEYRRRRIEELLASE